MSKSKNNTRKNLLAGLNDRDESIQIDPMAKKLQKSISKSNTPLSKEKIYELPIKDILSNPFQYRTEENLKHSGIKNLADSIVEHGLQVPIQVRRKEDKFILVAGWRRLTAYKTYIKAVSTIKATINDEIDDKTHKLLTIIENEQREDFTVIEKARAYNDLIENENYSNSDVAKHVGISKSRISKVLKFLSLPEYLVVELNNALINGLSNSAGEEIVSGYSHLKHSDPENADEWVKNIINKCLEENLSIKEIRELIHKHDLINKNKEKIKSKKPLKKHTIDGGPWKRFEVSTRNKVTLEFQLPEDFHYNDNKAIASYLKSEILKSIGK